MANSAAMCSSFKTDLLNGIHAFGTTVARTGTTVDTFNGALYYASGSLSSTTTVYLTTAEVTGTGYTAGGAALTNATPPANSAGTAYWTPSASLAWTGLTIASSFDTLLVYNVTTTSKNAVASFSIGAQTITSGTLTLTMPTNNNSSGLIRLA